MKKQRFISNHSPDFSQDAALRQLSRDIHSGGPSTQCPDESQLAALVEGRLNPFERETLHLHLAECETCLETYSLLCGLIRDAAPDRHSRRSRTPLALAASLVLVVISFLLFGPHGRDLAPEIEPASANAPLKEKGSTGKKGDGVKDETTAESRAPLGARHETPVSPPSGKEVESAEQPVPGQDRALLKADTTEDSAKGQVERQSRPAEKSRISAGESRVRNLETARKTPMVITPRDAGEWAEDIRIDAGPVNTPAGRVSAMLALNEQGKITEITVKPSDSPLAPLVSRALFAHAFPPASTPLRYLRLTIEWNGESWKIQPSSSSNSGESESGGSTSF